MSKNFIRVLKLVNGIDLIADLSDYANPPAQSQDDYVFISGVYLPEVLSLSRVRVLLSQPTPNGMQVGMLPVNFEDQDDEVKFEIFRDKILGIHELITNSRLVESFLESTSKIAISTSFSQGFTQQGMQPISKSKFSVR